MSKPREHRCTVCGKVGEWSESWGWFGSINHMDTCPDDVPKACSEECAAVIAAKLKSGEWALPVLRAWGPHCEVVIAKHGY